MPPIRVVHFGTPFPPAVAPGVTRIDRFLLLDALHKFQNRKVQETLYCLDKPTPTTGTEPEDQPPQMNTDHDLKTPDDSILDYINCQAPNDEQLEQALQTYPALTS